MHLLAKINLFFIHPLLICFSGHTVNEFFNE